MTDQTITEQRVWTKHDGYLEVDGRDRDRSALSDVPKTSTGSGFYSHHHRQLGHKDHSPANLVLLTGSGTTGEHGWVHSNIAAARILGYIVPSWGIPADTPIFRMDAYGTGYGWHLQTDDGGLESCSPPADYSTAEILEALADFEMLRIAERRAANRFSL